MAADYIDFRRCDTSLTTRASKTPGMGRLAAVFQQGLGPCTLAALAGLTVWRSGLGDEWPPASLRQAGLYADFAKRKPATDYQPYSPQYPLWADGAGKQRWIHLPPGKTIDVRNPDRWVFPVGTRIWKEFSIHGRPVETRLMEAQATGHWLFASYVWKADGSDAQLVPRAGQAHVAEVAPGISYDIPAAADCLTCHGLHQPEVLGFSALQLSPDLDPNAPSETETRAPDRLDLAKLMAAGRLNGAPATWTKQPPRIAGRGPQERSALGYLHGNCGSCHDSQGNLAVLGLNLRHREGVPREPALTAVGRPSGYQIPGTPLGQTLFIRAGDSTFGSIVYRMASRNPIVQMPPLATRMADDRALALLRAWIGDELPKNEAAANQH